jgi:hypothetical protein
MSRPDTAHWTRLGATSNADVYEIEPQLIAIVPQLNAVDDEHSARESLVLQAQHWKKVGHTGAVVVFMDDILEQHTGARTVYATETQGHPTTCYALVGETFYGHAVGAVFTGLAKPAIPTNIFRSLDEARPWIAEMNRQRGGKL